MKNMVIAGLLAAAASGAMADGAFDGVNAQIGLGFASIGNESTVSNEGNSYINNKTSQPGMLGTIAAGYSYGFNKQFNLGANIFYNFGSDNAGSASLFNGAVTQQSKVKNLWGISVEPGYYFGDKSLGFVKLGWAMASTTQSAFDGDGSVNVNTGTANGFLYGLGFKQLVTDNIYVGIDAYQVTFSSVSSTQDWGNGGINFQSKPNYTFGGINVGYKF